MSEPGAALDAQAELVERLAVLVEAGLSPVAAWRELAADGPGSVAAVVAELVVAGGADAIPDRVLGALDARPVGDHDGLRALAAVWRVATAAGAPLAPTLARLAAVLRDLAQGEREIETALAGPRATSRLVLALPPLGLLLGGLLGIDVLGALFGSVLGGACLVLGVSLLVLAVRWNRRLRRRASAREPAPGLALDLLAVALAGGAPPTRARQYVVDALSEAHLPADAAELDRQLAFATRAGIPVGELARSAAVAERRRARAAGARRAAEFETRLVLPLGLCVLPAFVVLGVAPVGIAIVSSTALLG
ncbi:type II secretion system F family protein [uncultured Schumannella sp.]|uniref:type II secretion system F family protein n=1 Tax=uncultured Schumannella sp. TaxID=1195956 RepID=UPI0025F95741|nr:type II secretion system F family protein [uncultured Schumannella sp.]